MSKVNFEDKIDFVDNPTIPEKNKLTAQNINDIKKGVNESVTVKVDDVVQNELSLSTTRDVTSQKVHVQVKTADGKIAMIESTTDDVYLGNVNLTDVFSLIKQFINICQFFSEDPTSVLSAINNVLPDA